MNKQRDLLPWILGGVSTAAVALVITAVSSQRAVTPAAQTMPAATMASTQPTLPASPVPLATSAPVPGPATIPTAAVVASPPAAPTAAEARSEARPGQIWTCTTKGVKTFSNNPCGENSSLLEVGPINTMNPTTPVRYAQAYPAQPRYVPAYSEPGQQSYAEDDSEQDGYEGGANSYTIVQGVAVLPRRRPEHHHPHHPPYHQPYQHTPAPAPRKF